MCEFRFLIEPKGENFGAQEIDVRSGKVESLQGFIVTFQKQQGSGNGTFGCFPFFSFVSGWRAGAPHGGTSHPSIIYMEARNDFLPFYFKIFFGVRLKR